MLQLGKYTSDGPSLKRPRDTTGEESSSISYDTLPASHTESSTPTTIAEQTQLEVVVTHPPYDPFSLPLHTEELGRLPAYDDTFNLNFQLQPGQYHHPQSHHLTPDPPAFGEYFSN